MAVWILDGCRAPINYSALALQRMRPELLERTELAWSAAAERELTLANSMCQFNPRKRNCRRFKRLEGKHWRAAALDRSMILLDDVVEIASTSHHDSPPVGVLFSQKAQRPVTCRVAVEIYLSGPPRLMGF